LATAFLLVNWKFNWVLFFIILCEALANIKEVVIMTC
jgi:hypothetical protein